GVRRRGTGMSVEIDVRDLLSQPGASRTVRVSESIPGLGTELATVPEDHRIDAELLLESVVEGVLVSGPVSGSMVLACARCLKSFGADLHLQVKELFSPDAAVGDDKYPVHEGEIDLEPMIRDAVLLSMPFAPLCCPDCLGLCERCGGDRNLGECVCAPEVDPRWGPLSAIDVERVERGTRDRSR
ncbi:MAG TPA: DUF177 domain-containing protein, partial [Actinomycetota bacterium]|nr:DUF177 domain-containing protein [Actinomycetota bacterium]